MHAIEEAIEFVQKHALHGAEIGAVRRKGRWCCYDYEDLLKRDKLSLDLFWIKDRSLTDTAALPAPGVVAAEIADDLMTALEQFTKIADRLK